MIHDVRSEMVFKIYQIKTNLIYQAIEKVYLKKWLVSVYNFAI